jgi:signal-transduction protein with cAMP-binding, CBS, and nucleotidyltransferase domain
MKIQDLTLSTAMQYVKDCDNLNKVKNELTHDGVSAQIVVDSNNNICGIITNNDLLKLSYSDFQLLTAKDICSSTLISISEHDSIEQAAQMMIANKCHHLLVTNNSKENIKGILSSLDLVSHYAASS